MLPRQAMSMHALSSATTCFLASLFLQLRSACTQTSPGMSGRRKRQPVKNSSVITYAAYRAAKSGCYSCLGSGSGQTLLSLTWHSRIGCGQVTRSGGNCICQDCTHIALSVAKRAQSEYHDSDAQARSKPPVCESRVPVHDAEAQPDGFCTCKNCRGDDRMQAALSSSDNSTKLL